MCVHSVQLYIRVCVLYSNLRVNNHFRLRSLYSPDESGHTQGPLDGSLYATILKSPKSPTATTHLISPPAEFSNGSSKSLLLLNGNGPPPPVPERSKTPNSIYLSQNGTPRSTPVPFALAPTPAASPAFGDRSVRAVSSASNSVSVNSSYSSYQSASPGVATVPDGGSPGTTLATPGGTKARPPSAQQVDGRESVRSPLTVSMDSGISSSGPVNRKLFALTKSLLAWTSEWVVLCAFLSNHWRTPCSCLFPSLFCIVFGTFGPLSGRVQGSSVSPSSFPSPQASPQGR